ncbi:MAG: VIT1/CCC1 transporter family protein [Methanobacteriota archaeon]|nr:MAG: VIT1/CCC1 transporter family protein [Euryarchaeota archaeon]
MSAVSSFQFSSIGACSKHTLEFVERDFPSVLIAGSESPMVVGKQNRLKAWHGEDWHTPRGRLIRDIVYAVDTGLITTVAFLAGVSALVDTNDSIVLAGLAQVSAGAIAIFFGAYISTKAQKDFFENQVRRETEEIEMMPERESQEIREIFEDYGFSAEEQETAVRVITSDKKLWLKFMVQEEIGISPEAIDDPLKIGSTAMLSFLVGAFPAILPFFVLATPEIALMVSAVAILTFLFVLGMWKSRLTKVPKLLSGAETLAIGGISCGLGFLFGRIVHLLIG